MSRRTGFYLVGFAFGSIAACGGLSHEQGADGAAEAVRGAGSTGSAGNGSGSAGNGSGSAGNGLGSAGSGSMPSTPGAGGSSATTGTPPAVPALRVPEKHRAQAAACDHERPAGYARPYNEPVACLQDGGTCALEYECPTCRSACIDYGDGVGPRCVTGNGECLSDADCTAQDNGRCWDNRGRWFCTYDSCYSDATCTDGGPCACEGDSGSPGNTCLPGNCQTDTDCGGKGYCSPTFGGCGNYTGVIAYYCHTTADTCLDDAECGNPTQGAGYCMYAPEVGHWACGYGQCVG